jgi:hypothetical protein
MFSTTTHFTKILFRTKREDEIWYFKSANGDGLRIPIKVQRHDVLDVQVNSQLTFTRTFGLATFGGTPYPIPTAVLYTVFQVKNYLIYDMTFMNSQ